MELVAPDKAIDEVTVAAIRAGMVAAIAKHGLDQTVLAEDMTDERRLAILVEEVGEVARAMTYDEGGDTDALCRELLQVACVAAGWAQRLDQHGRVAASVIG